MTSVVEIEKGIFSVCDKDGKELQSFCAKDNKTSSYNQARYDADCFIREIDTKLPATKKLFDFMEGVTQGEDNIIVNTDCEGVDFWRMVETAKAEINELGVEIEYSR